MTSDKANALLFVILNIIDAAVTRVALGSGAVELNPLMVTYGSSIPVKALGAAVIAVLLWRWAPGVFIPLNIAMAVIVAWNIMVCLVI